jgi:acetyl-CoA acetyltransferase family protein
MSTNPNNPVIAVARRSPFGKYLGGLSRVRPDDLLSELIRDLVSSVPALMPEEIDDVIIGDANQAGDDNRNVARMSSLLAGLPVSVPGVTVNRLCGSSAEALIQASRLIRTGEASIVLAGGVESMSRAPWIVERLGDAAPEMPTFNQSTVGWRLVNPKMPSQWTTSLGRAAEVVAEKFGISRERQDEWALRSHNLAQAAWSSGFHAEWVLPIAGVQRDESIRADTTLEKLSGLKSAFSEGGSITAGNSSPLNDGATLALITNTSTASTLNLQPIASIAAAQVVGVEPHEFSIAPVFAIRKLLKKQGLSISEIDVWEINEAFAAMVLSVLHELPEIDIAKVNVNGGAIAMGHPVGASAARAVIDCARELKRVGGRYGIAAACIGVGQGIAVLVHS